MTRRHLSLVLSLPCVLALASAAVAAEKPARPAVKGWSALYQVMKALQTYVTTEELSSIHNEDMLLRSAIAVLDSDKEVVVADKRPELSLTLSAFGRAIAELHESADAFNQAETKVRLQKVLASFEGMKRLYGEDTLAPARALASKWACPMHRDVVGKDTDKCPKCGMLLDQPVRVPLLISGGGVPALHTVQASVQMASALEVGKEAKGFLRLKQFTGAPVLLTDLRVVHTQRIHFLVVDASLTDYHHLHPTPTGKDGEYAFSFTPAKPGGYRAWADLRTTMSGYQEYAMVDIPGTGKGEPITDQEVKLRAEAEGLRYVLTLAKKKVRVGEPVQAKLRVTDDKGRPFKELEPVMATFAHLVAFNEDHQTVLHLHPKATKVPQPTDRGGPELEFQIYADQPGFHRLFAQVQIKGVSKFIPFGLKIDGP